MNDLTAARVRTVALVGIEGFIVEVEGRISSGRPGLHIIGLPDATTNETRDRVRAAIVNSGLKWPCRHMTVQLLPASLPKHGGGYDLAIAIAILAAAGELPLDACANTVLVGELALDGRIRSVPGVFPAVLTASRAGHNRAMIPSANAIEAQSVPETTTVAVDSLEMAVAILHGKERIGQAGVSPDTAESQPASEAPSPSAINLSRIGSSAPLVRQALEVSAAGCHHLLLVGGEHGKAMLAKALWELLPDLDHDQAQEVTAIHSVAGVLTPGTGLISRPPFREPHHTAATTSIRGGGRGPVWPGEISLAHRGVLHLEDAPEFHRGVLDAVGTSAETGEIFVARSGSSVRFPAMSTLVLTAAPCPCTGTDGCNCSPGSSKRYLGRLPERLLARTELSVSLPRRTLAEVQRDLREAEPGIRVAERVSLARSRAQHRLSATPWRTNAEVPRSQLRRFAPSPEAVDLLTSITGGTLSAHAARIVRVAWTLADLNGSPVPGPAEINNALDLCRLPH